MPAQTEIFTLQGASDLRTYVTMCTHSATKRQIKTQTRPRRPLKPTEINNSTTETYGHPHRAGRSSQRL